VTDQPSNDGRKTDGRFAPGNKASHGKAKGTRHKATSIAEKLFASDIADIAKKVVQAAKNGESWACRLVIERLIGVAKEAPEQTYVSPIDYTAPATPEQARSLILALGERVARGVLSIEAHDVLVGGLRIYLGDKAAEQEKKLAAIERHIRYGAPAPWETSTPELSN
jgi:hypothetical protein